MKIRNIIENDIVEDIEAYRDIQESFVELIRTVKPKYVPTFTFNEFCIRLMDNFDGVDEEIDFLDASLLEKLLESVFKMASNELNNDEDLIRVIKDNIN